MTGILGSEKIAIMHKFPPILFLMLGVLAGAINAAQQPQPPQPVKPFVPCTLVSKADIEQAIDTPVGYGVPQMTAREDVCAYSNPKGTTVKISVYRSQNKRDLSTLADAARKALPNATVRELPGLGEKALLVEYPKGGTMLSVYRGGDALVVMVYGIANGAKADAAAEKIARKAFSRF